MSKRLNLIQNFYLTAVQRLNYSPAHCLAIEDSANGATGAMNAGLDVIINTNEMTEAQDFSAITFVGKDLSFEQIKIVSLNQIRSKLMSWQIILFSFSRSYYNRHRKFSFRSNI